MQCWKWDRSRDACPLSYHQPKNSLARELTRDAKGEHIPLWEINLFYYFVQGCKLWEAKVWVYTCDNTRVKTQKKKSCRAGYYA